MIWGLDSEIEIELQSNIIAQSRSSFLLQIYRVCSRYTESEAVFPLVETNSDSNINFLQTFF